MRKEELTNILYDIIPPERIAIYHKFIDLFTAYESDSYTYYLDELITTMDQYDTQTFLLRLDDIVYEEAASIISLLGITLSDDIGLNDTLSILDGLHQLEHQSSYDKISQIIYANDDKVVAVCEVLAFITQIQSGVYLTHIYDVNDELIDNILALSNTSTSDNQPMSYEGPIQDAEYNNLKMAIKKYISDKPDSVIHVLLENEVRIRCSYEEALSVAVKNNCILYSTVSSSVFPTKDEAAATLKVAEQFIGICLYTGQRFSEALSAVRVTITRSGMPPAAISALLTAVEELGSKVLSHG